MKKIKINIALIALLIYMLGCAERSLCSSIESALLSVHGSLVAAIYNTQLGKKLDLTQVFLDCNEVVRLRTSMVVPYSKNDEVAVVIVQHINEYLMRNSKLIEFLENLNGSIEKYRKLSEADIAMILGNSALLFSINDVLSLGRILAIVRDADYSHMPVQNIGKMLKVVELDESKCVLQLWEKRNYLRRLYEHLQYQAPTLSEKMKYARKCAKMQKIMITIVSLLGITKEYA